MFCISGNQRKQVDPSVVVSAFGAESMAQITQATAQLAQVAPDAKGKIMIDWATAKLPCRHDPSKLISGMVMSFLTHRVTMNGSLIRN